jgi:tRNA A37 threonylcarbamoyladenosine synthetase subunit TsaC/SUA5/YrdC
MHKKSLEWICGRERVAVDLLLEGGRMIVSPTKVGYIIMTTDIDGLTRKFSSKKRALNKPGVVLCGSMEQLRKLAVVNAETDAFYQTAWDNDILLGCILPCKEDAKRHIPRDGSESLMMDQRSTSCFVIKFGEPSELIARALWEDHGTLAFASSATPRERATPAALTALESASITKLIS